MSRKNAQMHELQRRYRQMQEGSPTTAVGNLAQLRYVANRAGIYDFNSVRPDKKLRFVPLRHKFFGAVAIAGGVYLGMHHDGKTPIQSLTDVSPLPTAAVVGSTLLAGAARGYSVKRARNVIYDFNPLAHVSGLHPTMHGVTDAASTLLEGAGVAAITLGSNGVHIDSLNTAQQVVAGVAATTIGLVHHYIEGSRNAVHQDKAVINMTNAIQRARP